MRKIVMLFSVSLDGYIERLDRRIDWHLVDEELHRHMNDVLRPMGGFISGRVTWELMAGYWPTADADPDAPGPIVEFAEIWRSMPKSDDYVRESVERLERRWPQLVDVEFAVQEVPLP
ncbi:hypothetical protein ABZ641_35055, partial [Kitasatospora sp. NPDC007106]